MNKRDERARCATSIEAAFHLRRGISTCAVIAFFAHAAIGATGQEPFPNYSEPELPQMEPCAQRTPVPLPEKWEAISLMSPYLYHGVFPNGAELRVGRFTYDASVGAMRAGVYRVGTTNLVDLLIAHDNTWVLGGSWENPTCLANWGTNLPVPGRIWQGEKAVCVGNQRTAPTIRSGPKVDWWKQPSPIMARGAEGQAGDWFWFDENGYPTRTFFWGDHSGLPAVLSEYAYSNFSSFEPVETTDLESLIAMCNGTESLPTFDENMRIAFRETEQASVEKHSIVGELIPGLSAEACSDPDIEPPHWPKQIYMTSFSTAAKFKTPRPISTSVYYDPEGPNLRTRLHKIEQNPNTNKPFNAFSDALLIDQSSYGIDFLADPPYTQLDCAKGPHTSIPGAPHPDWGARGGCQCMAVIDNNPVLSPNRKTQVVSCPLADYSGDTLFWMWYTAEEPPEPIVFLQTRADITIGTGLSLADYYHWEEPPTTPIAGNIYTAPTGCEFPPASAPTPPAACLQCHNPATNTGHGASRWSR